VDSFDVTVGLDHRSFRDREMWTANRGKGPFPGEKEMDREDNLPLAGEDPSGDQGYNIHTIDLHV
jgi:hypothetical protein